LPTRQALFWVLCDPTMTVCLSNRRATGFLGVWKNKKKGNTSVMPPGDRTSVVGDGLCFRWCLRFGCRFIDGCGPLNLLSGRIRTEFMCRETICFKFLQIIKIMMLLIRSASCRCTNASKDKRRLDGRPVLQWRFEEMSSQCRGRWSW
jgi:hypothetical protein